MPTLTFSGLGSGMVKTSMDGKTYTEATSPITLVDGMYIFVSGYRQPVGKPAIYIRNVHVDNGDIWSTSQVNPYILTYGGMLNYTTSETSTEDISYYAKYVGQPKTTFDLSTLSDITDGTHTVKAKAKADGYIDSEFSNEVSYTKSSKQIVTLKATGSAGFVYSVNAELTSSTASTSITAGEQAVLEYDTLPTYIEVCPSYYSWNGSPSATGASVNATSRRYGASDQTIYRVTNITNGAIVNCPVTD